MNIYNKILSGLAVLGLASLLALAPAPASASGLIVNQIHYNDLIVVPYRSTLTVPPNTRYILSSTLVDDDGLQLPDDEQRGAGEATYTAGYYIVPNGGTCNANAVISAETNFFNLALSLKGQPTPSQITNLLRARGAVAQAEGNQFVWLQGSPTFQESPALDKQFIGTQLTAPSQPTTFTVCEVATEFQTFEWLRPTPHLDYTFDTDLATVQITVAKPTTPPPLNPNNTGNPTSGGTGGSGGGSAYITILPPYPGTASENAYNEAMLSMPLLPTSGHETTSTSPDKKASVITFATQTWTSAVLVKWAFSTPFPDIYGQANGEHAWGFSSPSYNPTLTITVPPNGVGIQFKYPVVATITFTVEQQQSTTTTTNAGTWQPITTCSITATTCPTADQTTTYHWTGTPHTSTSVGATSTQTYSKSYQVSSLGSVLN